MEGQYHRQAGEPVWMPEIGLGIGRVQGQLEGIDQEWLAWHDVAGNPYPLPEEMIRKLKQRAEQERLRAEQAELRAQQAELRTEQERQRAEYNRLEMLRILQEQQQLLEKLREKGIDVDSL
jgi:Rps23 Pro-64 3,4-dihydroxylase Tpa1-like proline 4-hydroxylase